MFSLFNSRPKTISFPPLSLYNSETRSPETFVSLSKKEVKLYSCGPTVYDYAHIGNLRAYVFADTLKRTLLYNGYVVNHTINYTDFGHLTSDADTGDDKMMKGLRREGLDISLDSMRLLSDRYIKAFNEDLIALNIIFPTQFARASDYVREQIALIKTLEQKGYTYATSDGIYFDIAKFPSYGRLGNIQLAELQNGARVEINPEKHHPADFALWKHGELGWKSDWGVGFPGWHIECSAMSAVHLGETFDIHGGGLDLIFPHHENEIAQSRCAYGHDVMANVWMHNGFLQVEGRKMSKSEGNFVTIHELLETEKFGGQSWDGLVLRLAMLMTHYRQPIDFSNRRLEEAKSIVERWADYKIEINSLFGGEMAAWRAEIEPESSILDDLNLHPLISEMSSDGAAGAKGDRGAALSFYAALELLGFEGVEANSRAVASLEIVADDVLSDSLDAIIQMRLEMLKAKNFAEADRIRDDLAAKGIQLKDGKDAATGERVTTWEVKR